MTLRAGATRSSGQDSLLGGDALAPAGGPAHTPGSRAPGPQGSAQCLLEWRLSHPHGCDQGGGRPEGVPTCSLPAPRSSLVSTASARKVWAAGGLPPAMTGQAVLWAQGHKNGLRRTRCPHGQIPPLGAMQQWKEAKSLSPGPPPKARPVLGSDQPSDPPVSRAAHLAPLAAGQPAQLDPQLVHICSVSEKLKSK